MESKIAAGPVAERITQRVASALGAARFEKYFASAASLRFGQEGVDVITPSPLIADWLGRRFGAEIREAARHETGEDDVRVRFSVDANAFRSEPGRRATESIETNRPSQGRAGRNDAAPPAPAPSRAPASAQHRPRRAQTRLESLPHRLETFIAGPNNELALRTAERIGGGDAPGELSPFFIHGECGLGKTHLLQGIAARFLTSQPGSRVLYTTGESFTNAFIGAVKANRIDAFHREHRGLDLLCIDDVHFLSNKTATQAEFLHTFNALNLERARIVLASDEHPTRFGAFSKELVSRFVAGMVVRLERPDLDTRTRITQAMALRRGIPLDGEAVRAVAARCTTSVREIEGALTRIEALHRLVQPGAPGKSEATATIGVGLVHRALGVSRLAAPSRPAPLTLIVEVVATDLAVDLSELLGRSRHKRVVLARSVAAYLSRKLSASSFPEIARALGRPNHSTVVSACKRVDRMVKADARCEAGPDLDGVSITELIDRLARRVISRIGSA